MSWNKGNNRNNMHGATIKETMNIKFQAYPAIDQTAYMDA